MMTEHGEDLVGTQWAGECLGHRPPSFVQPQIFFRPTPDGSRQVVYQAGKTTKEN